MGSSVFYTISILSYLAWESLLSSLLSEARIVRNMYHLTSAPVVGIAVVVSGVSHGSFSKKGYNRYKTFSYVGQNKINKSCKRSEWAFVI